MIPSITHNLYEGCSNFGSKVLKVGTSIVYLVAEVAIKIFNTLIHFSVGFVFGAFVAVFIFAAQPAPKIGYSVNEKEVADFAILMGLGFGIASAVNYLANE